MYQNMLIDTHVSINTISELTIHRGLPMFWRGDTSVQLLANKGNHVHDDHFRK